MIAIGLDWIAVESDIRRLSLPQGVMSSKYIGSDLSIFFVVFITFFSGSVSRLEWLSYRCDGIGRRMKGIDQKLNFLFLYGRLQRWQHLRRQLWLAQLVGRRGSADAAASQEEVAAQSHVLHQRADRKSRERLATQLFFNSHLSKATALFNPPRLIISSHNFIFYFVVVVAIIQRRVRTDPLSRCLRSWTTRRKDRTTGGSYSGETTSFEPFSTGHEPRNDYCADTFAIYRYIYILPCISVELLHMSCRGEGGGSSGVFINARWQYGPMRIIGGGRAPLALGSNRQWGKPFVASGGTGLFVHQLSVILAVLCPHASISSPLKSMIEILASPPLNRWSGHSWLPFKMQLCPSLKIWRIVTDSALPRKIKILTLMNFPHVLI